MNSLIKNVNLIINENEIWGVYFNKEMEENEYFNHVFKEYKRKLRNGLNLFLDFIDFAQNHVRLISKSHPL